MKRLVSLLLCAVLLAGLTVTAGAESGAGDRLSQVTAAVKKTLDLDTEAYDDFQGDSYEDSLARMWSLQWSGTGGSLTVEALEDGTIVSFRLDDDETSSSGGFPAFPSGDTKKASQAAQTFLNRVLDKDTESVKLGEPEGEDRLGGTELSFSGQILLNGLPSALTYSMTVRSSDNQVTWFRRDVPETAFLGTIPAAQASVTQAKAAEMLGDKLGLRLEYVLPEADSTQAVLRYLPQSVHTFYVDARTGELLDMTELEGKLWQSAGGAESPSEDSAEGESGLSQAEQEGIQKLEGVLPSDKLETLIREEKAYGLDRYTLASAAYVLEKGTDGEEDQVLCTLRFSRSDGNGTYGRTVQVDARTGEVLSVYSRVPWDKDRQPKVSRNAALTAAEAFLKDFAGDRFDHLALYEVNTVEGEGDPCYYFTFARRENDIFFPDNGYSVAIDGSDGSVYSLSYTYDETLTFQAPEGLVTAQAALKTWVDSYDVTLGYRLVPQPLSASDPAQAKLMQQGLKYYYGLRLTYAQERETYYLGVDAKSGQLVERKIASPQAPAYTDLSGSWARADIETLSRYGVGYEAETFQAGKQLTQWDLVCLLASLEGFRLDPAGATEEEKDAAYDIVCRMGAMSRADRDEEKLLTRGQVVQMLLDASGYGPAARLQGIYTCSYGDRNTIPADQLGYAALAQGLKLVQGNYAGSRTATRAEAAVMLCRLLRRS